jgi:ribosomal protein S6--L-glutamate ligase
MIVSFHPIIEAHENLICAGRQPDGNDLAAIKQADAVILPQGCSEALYRMARHNCLHVFPNLDVRFGFPGKRGQIQLFQRYGVDHPQTRTYDSVVAFHQSSQKTVFPSVVKLDWGGQGDTVFKASDLDEMNSVLKRVESYESTGQQGFLVQEFVPHGGRSLRVVVIGSRFISYWRVQPADLPFGTSVADGAAIDPDFAPRFQKAARDAARQLCTLTSLQLAGLDYIFDETDGNTGRIRPLILEVNYYFGRTGLGGSDKYYGLLMDEVDKWLSSLSLSR